MTRLSLSTRRVLADNPGPFTSTGTCSYIVGEGEIAIIDPGPGDERRVAVLLAAIKGETLRYILVTHTHADHSAAAAALRKQTGALVAGCAPYEPRDPMAAGAGLDAAHDRAYAPDRVLREGETLRLGGCAIEAVQTPGHTANGLCFALHEERALFTGDHVMAWATTVVAPPDGSMRDYLASLEKLRDRDDAIYWPGHGGPVRKPQRWIRAILHHRRQREAAILLRLEKGDATIATIVARVYQGLDPRLHFAAALSTLAHLEHLIEKGLAHSEGEAGLGARFFRS